LFADVDEDEDDKEEELFKEVDKSLEASSSSEDTPLEECEEVPKGMHPRDSFSIYPRLDNLYKKKTSFNFDMLRAKVFERKAEKCENAWIWFTHALIGISVGTIAFVMAFVEDHLIIEKAHFTQYLIDSSNDRKDPTYAYLFFVLANVLCVLVSSLLTVYVGPGAMGSGVAEIMGTLNGLNLPDVLTIRSLLVKIVGTTFAVSGGLCIGKEGPLLHIGAIMGIVMCYLPFDGVRPLQNDVIKR